MDGGDALKVPAEVLKFRNEGLTMTHRVPHDKILTLRKEQSGELLLAMKPHWNYLEKFLRKKGQQTLFIDQDKGPKILGICSMNTPMETNGRTWTLETYWQILDVEKWEEVSTWLVVLGREIK
jgi:hypothetical protein